MLLKHEVFLALIESINNVDNIINIQDFSRYDAICLYTEAIGALMIFTGATRYVVDNSASTALIHPLMLYSGANVL